MGLGENLFKGNVVMPDSRPGPTFDVALAEAMGEPRGEDEKGIESVRVEPCCEIVRQKRLPTALIRPSIFCFCVKSLRGYKDV
jgi:hypothetical protein